MTAKMLRKCTLKAKSDENVFSSHGLKTDSYTCSEYLCVAKTDGSRSFIRGTNNPFQAKRGIIEYFAVSRHTNYSRECIFSTQSLCFFPSFIMHQSELPLHGMQSSGFLLSLLTGKSLLYAVLFVQCCPKWRMGLCLLSFTIVLGTFVLVKNTDSLTGCMKVLIIDSKQLKVLSNVHRLQYFHFPERQCSGGRTRLRFSAFAMTDSLFNSAHMFATS